METTNYEDEDNFALMKLVGNEHQFLYQNLVNFGRKLYYNFNGNDDQFGLNESIIAVKDNSMKFYRFFNIKKSFDI